MACERNVVVRNTFIDLSENRADDDTFSNEGETSKSLTRTRSDPTLRASFVELQKQDSVKYSKDGFHGGTEASWSRPTSAGYEDSRSEDNSQTECCSRDAPLPMVKYSCLVAPASSPAVSPGRRNHPEDLLQQHMFDVFGGEKEFSDIKRDLPSEWQGKTSVMVRNVSYKCTRTMLCNEMNKAGFEEKFDYVYLPVDAARGTSKGYAFVNLMDDVTAYKFKEYFDGRRMDIPGGGGKRLEVIPSNLQGYSQNASHYVSKQNELSVAAKVPATTLRANAVKPGKVDQSSVSPQSVSKAEAANAPSGSVDQAQMSKCRKCNGPVLAKARFCQWCGAGL
eukprot:TRINITY_DN1887_c2_g1_i1.p1 TRINITY_DN1887_c2_g1~~TRINITY_DN1887_c2_g1_i1.p1  ORF type:complete len:336 (-),score=34.93 TRINITY_DN1887_c2_g1_i1:403-1410(-)